MIIAIPSTSTSTGGTVNSACALLPTGISGLQIRVRSPCFLWRTDWHAEPCCVLPLGVQFPVMPEDAGLIERNATLGCEIGGNAWPRRDPVVQRYEARMLRF
jgi:hypothetical protein